ncbi:MAG TPA: 3-hydroxyacyl-CoA dehydrogenase family protein [Candidatus Binatia bacterium]|nr:3-hydroxyacyl-CoA dehydrogenase family protein [Candidatus Binatia bacterium]
MSTPNIHKLGILGAGQMGLGIAQVAARAGLATTLVKMTPGSVDGVRKKIDASFAKEAEKGRMTPDAHRGAMEKLATSSDMTDLAGCDLVVESIVEDLPTKIEAFRRLDELCGPSTIFATNTSTLGVTAMAIATKRPGRFIGLHFFNPATAMKLVEVASTLATEPGVVDAAKELCVALGKTPVVVPDTTGFVVNRLLVPYLLDAMRVWQEGTASIADVETAMMNGAGHPMGPFALADFIGLDVVFHMASNLYDEYREPRFTPPPVLRRLVLAGQLGRKSGLGFLDYSQRPAQPNSALSRRPA